MAKASLSKLDVDALLKLRGDVDRQLSSRGRELEQQLSRLGMLQAGLGKGRTAWRQSDEGSKGRHQVPGQVRQHMGGQGRSAQVANSCDQGRRQARRFLGRKVRRQARQEGPQETPCEEIGSYPNIETSRQRQNPFLNRHARRAAGNPRQSASTTPIREGIVKLLPPRFLRSGRGRCRGHRFSRAGRPRGSVSDGENH